MSEVPLYGPCRGRLGVLCACEHVYPLARVSLRKPHLRITPLFFCLPPRAFCTGGLDPRDLKQRFCADPFYKEEVLACVGCIHNLKDLKDLLKDLQTDARREPSALEGWILQVLYCDPNGSRAFLRILSAEGRGVRLCWGKPKPKGSQARNCSHVPYVSWISARRRCKDWADVGAFFFSFFLLSSLELSDTKVYEP